MSGNISPIGRWGLLSCSRSKTHHAEAVKSSATVINPNYPRCNLSPPQRKPRSVGNLLNRESLRVLSPDFVKN